MQKAAELTIEIYQGAAFVWPLVWKTGTPPAPVDLTDYSASLTIFRQGKPDPVIVASTGTPPTSGSAITVTPAEGRFDILITEADTSPLTWKDGSFVLEVTPPGGHVRRLAFGPVRVIPRRETV